jgi:tRNA(Arg) A34 adenosine deaminase TadA
MNMQQKLDPALAALDLEALMREALAEAETAGRAGGRPIGAVVVVRGQIVSRSQARDHGFKSQLLHAEIKALLDGGDPLWEHYRDAVLVTTVEPCPLCLGAAVMADVPHIVFASHDEVAGAASRQIVATVPYVQRHIVSYLGGVLEAESRALLTRFDPTLLAYITTGHMPSVVPPDER